MVGIFLDTGEARRTLAEAVADIRAQARAHDATADPAPRVELGGGFQGRAASLSLAFRRLHDATSRRIAAYHDALLLAGDQVSGYERTDDGGAGELGELHR